MKRLAFPLTCVLLMLWAVAAHAQTPPITQTVGTGSNTSYFVINFDDGPGNGNNPASDYVFAYHWDTGSDATSETLLADLNRLTSPQLQVNQTYYPDYNAYFINGFTYLSHSQTGYYNSAADQASWSYWVMDGGTWSEPQTYGVSGRALFNGSYDGWTFHVGPGGATAPQAAPEPASAAVLALGAGGVCVLALRRKRRVGDIA